MVIFFLIICVAVLCAVVIMQYNDNTTLGTYMCAKYIDDLATCNTKLKTCNDNSAKTPTESAECSKCKTDLDACKNPPDTTTYGLFKNGLATTNTTEAYKNLDKGMCLKAKADETIITAKCSADDTAQKWGTVDGDCGYVMFKHKDTGKCMGAVDATKDGEYNVLKLETCDKKDDKVNFKFENSGAGLDGYKMIFHKGSTNKFLEAGDKEKNVYTWNGAIGGAHPHQSWKIE